MDNSRDPSAPPRKPVRAWPGGADGSPPGECSELLAHVAEHEARSRLRVSEPRRLPRRWTGRSPHRTWRDRTVARLTLLSTLRGAEVLRLSDRRCGHCVALDPCDSASESPPEESAPHASPQQSPSGSRTTAGDSQQQHGRTTAHRDPAGGHGLRAGSSRPRPRVVQFVACLRLRSALTPRLSRPSSI